MRVKTPRAHEIRNAGLTDCTTTGEAQRQTDRTERGRYRKIHRVCHAQRERQTDTPVHTCTQKQPGRCRERQGE